MTLLEIIEKQKEEQKIKELALSQKITKEEASWRYYKGRAIKSIFETPQFYNMKHVKYFVFRQVFFPKIGKKYSQF